jgi:hypothetical protein
MFLHYIKKLTYLLELSNYIWKVTEWNRLYGIHSVHEESSLIDSPEAVGREGDVLRRKGRGMEDDNATGNQRNQDYRRVKTLAYTEFIL